MTDVQQNETSNPPLSEQYSATHKLARCMRAWVAYEDIDGHCFYANEIVSTAVAKGLFPDAVDELINYFQTSPTSFQTLLRSLFSLSPKTELEWQNIGETLNTFYDSRPYHKKENTWRLATEVKPLALICRKIENDIDYLGNLVTTQVRLFQKLKHIGSQYRDQGFIIPPYACPSLPNKPDKLLIEKIEDAKQTCFARIYQRTRELCKYEDETRHFYNAYKLVELFSGIALGKERVLTIRDQQLKEEDIIANLNELTNEYTEPLEEILKFVNTGELVTLILRQHEFRKAIRSVLLEVWHKIKKQPLDLDYEQSEGRLIPIQIGNQMLGPHVYKLFRARRVISNRLYNLMSQNARWKQFILDCTGEVDSST